MEVSKLVKKYHVVFNNEGDIKPCGRKACQDLILTCSQMEPNENFGNLNTGIMNVEAIKKFVKQYI